MNTYARVHNITKALILYFYINDEHVIFFDSVNLLGLYVETPLDFRTPVYSLKAKLKTACNSN